MDTRRVGGLVVGGLWARTGCFRCRVERVPVSVGSRNGYAGEQAASPVTLNRFNSGFILPGHSPEANTVGLLLGERATLSSTRVQHGGRGKVDRRRESIEITAKILLPGE